jgi:hypothetical protein
MPRVTRDICDRCGAVRPETGNHWFTTAWGFHTSTCSRSITIEEFHEASPDAETRFLCGDACVLAEVSDYLSKLKEGGTNGGKT